VVAHQSDDLLELLWLERGEGEVLELPFDGVHPEAVSQRSIDLEGLFGLSGRPVGRQVFPRARVVKAVSELDNEHSDVTSHRDDHLADGFSLSRLAPCHLVELGHAVDEPSDLVPEVDPQLLEGVIGVFHRVVQERCRDRVRGHPESSENLGHGERVGDVGVTALPKLALVGPLSNLVSADNCAQISPRVVVAHRGEDGFKSDVRDSFGGGNPSEG
jgi:hypothetical protein